MRLLQKLIISILFLGSASSALAEIAISHAWLRLLPPAMTTTAAYMDISSDFPDTLLKVTMPMAERVEIHQSGMKHGMMVMAHITQLQVPEGGQVSLSPKGYHLMVVGLKQALIKGKAYAMTFYFKQAGVVKIQVPVVAR